MKEITGREISVGFAQKKWDDPVTEKVIPSPSQYGKWNDNNGITNIVTPDGRVFIGETIHEDDDLDGSREFIALVNELCPNGKGGGVYGSNNELINGYNAILSTHNGKKILNPHTRSKE